MTTDLPADPTHLPPGTRLGPYEISSLLGEGGMGQVYRARDTKLNRDVALKILPATFALDADRVARFTREAQVLASLNHPNIAAIHGIEEQGSTRALVMELVEGEDLAAQIARGAIRIDDALPIARQIADALEAAHEQAIIHRDLKPANIKVRADGTVKVLDFGLAKALDQGAGIGNRGSGDAANAPTITTPAMTMRGMILGTAAYMSPEQARGKAVDKRADLWAFGVVVYEMLTGRRAFEGAEISDVLAAVLRAEPDWTRVPADTPAPLRRLLRRCLQKDAKKRLADAADARLEIEEALASPMADAPSPAVPSASRRWVVATATFALTTLAASAFILYDRVPGRIAPSDPRPAAVVTITFPGLSRAEAVAISPDGRRIAIAGRPRTAAADTRLYVRELNQPTVRELPGTGQAGLPFFSPDGRWIGFFTPRELKKVSIDGGAPSSLAELASRSTSPASLGGAWGADQSILFSNGNGISRVGASGGAPMAVTNVDHDWHALPKFLPGARFLLSKWILATSAPSFFEPFNASSQEIAVQGFDGTTRQTVLKGAVEAEYSQTGHLIFGESGTLFAVPFDVRSLATGPAVPLAEGLRPGRLGGGFSVSSVNSLVYLPPQDSVQRELVWVDRSGRAQPAGAPARPFVLPRLSPSGTQVVLTALDDEDRSTWIFDVDRGTLGRLSDDRPGQLPLWSPDGTRIAFESLSAGPAFFIKSVDGSGPTVEIDAPGTNPALQSWSNDGRTLLYQVSGTTTDRDLWTVSIDGGQKPAPLVQSRFFQGGASFSPDGKLVAWVSRETGTNQVYLQSYPGGAGRVQVSPDGGAEPVWSRSGKELFYRVDDRMMSVQVNTTPALVVGKPTVLFEGRYELYGGARPNYDVSPDGKRFLMLRSVDTSADAARIVYVAEWPQLITDKGPVTVIPGTKPQ